MSASQDGLVSCTCCSDGIHEIKLHCHVNDFSVSICHEDDSVSDTAKDVNFCLEKVSSGNFRFHAYYYQVCSQ